MTRGDRSAGLVISPGDLVVMCYGLSGSPSLGPNTYLVFYRALDPAPLLGTTLRPDRAGQEPVAKPGGKEHLERRNGLGIGSDQVAGSGPARGQGVGNDAGNL